MTCLKINFLILSKIKITFEDIEFDIRKYQSKCLKVTSGYCKVFYKLLLEVNFFLIYTHLGVRAIYVFANDLLMLARMLNVQKYDNYSIY